MTVQAYRPEPLLTCADVRVRFGGVVALDGVSLEVPRGQIVGIIGPNGAGKTTLFNVISRLYSVESGELTFDQQPLLSMSKHRIAEMGISRTFQNVALFETLSVRDNVRVGTHCRSGCGFVSDILRIGPSRSTDKIDARVDELLEALGLERDAHRLVRDLPFGTRKRVELGRALANEPKLLMLDEPAGGLNHGDVDELRELIAALRDTFELTVLLVEHHMNFVMKLCDYVVALDFGRKIAQGTPSQIQKDPEVIRAYLGGSA